MGCNKELTETWHNQWRDITHSLSDHRRKVLNKKVVFFFGHIFWFHWADGHLNFDGLNPQGQSKQAEKSSSRKEEWVKRWISLLSHLLSCPYVRHLLLQKIATPWPAPPAARCSPDVSFPGHRNSLISLTWLIPLNKTSLFLDLQGALIAHQQGTGSSYAHAFISFAVTPAPRLYIILTPSGITTVCTASHHN